MPDDNPSAQQPSADQVSSGPATRHLGPAEATELMNSATAGLRQQWLQSALNIANTLKSRQAVNRGTFEDLRRLRENYEELERARAVLVQMNSAAGGGQGAAG